MPLYEYECDHGHRFELIRKFSDPPVDTCPTCQAPARKLMSSPAIQFKGTGWYITDYAKKESTAAGKTGETAASAAAQAGATDGSAPSASASTAPAAAPAAPATTAKD